MIALFELDPGIDRASAAERYARDGRVQIQSFLTQETALTIGSVLRQETPWGIAWQAGLEGPSAISASQLPTLPQQERENVGARVHRAMERGDFAFLYAQYPMLDAYLENRGESEALHLLVEHVNSEPFLDLVREVSGLPGLVKTDAQATLYGPNHFLALHEDSHVEEGRVAYVMNFADEEWRPDWGGYLMFYDEEGDVTAGFRPRFNSLNLFAVPQRHAVSYVPPFAPHGRFAISGWLREG
jgi:Rps23 Pro-64 3,4-dihydroxylase Tpa1-like proline 4-hydroxylase